VEWIQNYDYGNLVQHLALI